MCYSRKLLLAIALLLAACRGQTLPPGVAPDECSSATQNGARERFSLDQIVACLDTPAAVSEFIANNVEYDTGYDDRERGGNEYVPASLVYQRGIDDADGHAILQCYLLEQNHWDAVVVGLSIDSPLGSNVCAVNTGEGQVLVLEGGGTQAGPFDSLSRAAQHYIAIGWMQSAGTLRLLEASKITQVTTDDTSPSVLGLPWTEVEY